MEYENPTPAVNPFGITENKKTKRMGLAIASLVLGGLSVICCFAYGLGIIPGLIAAIFGVISVISGEGKARVMGAIGLVLGVVGIVMGIVVIVSFASMINWDNVTPDSLAQFGKINPEDPKQVEQWLQQFFNIDISGIIK